jgi:hypothetical protein
LIISPYELAFIAGGFTIVGALVGGWIGYRSTLSIYRISEFNKAATSFRNAFIPEITFLKHNAVIPDNERHYADLNEFLEAGYIDRHLKAFEIFKNHLSSKERQEIDKAWREYCYHPDNQYILFFEQYSWRVANKGIGYEKQLQSLALNRIEKILEFAQPK